MHIKIFSALSNLLGSMRAITVLQLTELNLLLPVRIKVC